MQHSLRSNARVITTLSRVLPMRWRGYKKRNLLLNDRPHGKCSYMVTSSFSLDPPNHHVHQHLDGHQKTKILKTVRRPLLLLILQLHRLAKNMKRYGIKSWLNCHKWKEGRGWGVKNLLRTLFYNVGLRDRIVPTAIRSGNWILLMGVREQHINEGKWYENLVVETLQNMFGSLSNSGLDTSFA